MPQCQYDDGNTADATLWSGDGWLPDLFKDEQARIIFSSRYLFAGAAYAVDPQVITLYCLR